MQPTERPISADHASDQPPIPGGRLARFRNLLAPRARLWGFMVPLHLLAFLLLYVLSAHVMVSEIVTSTSHLARAQLDHENREFEEVALGHSGEGSQGHLFEQIVDIHDDIGYQMFLPGGQVIGNSALEPVDHREMVDFIESEEEQRVWLSEEGASRRMRGLKRLTARESCAPCHQTGELLAVTSMSLDLTELLARVLSRGRRNMFLLIVLWAALLGLTTGVVRRSVHVSTARIEAELEAVGTGVLGGSDKEPDLVLDAVSVRLQIALRDFLRRQRQRQAEVASRLAHTDQLASLGQLAAGLAHEIKNPLAGIQGALELLNEDEGSESTQLLYGEMLSELDRVNSTLQSLLASARPAPLQLSGSDARKLVQDVERLLSPGLARREVSLETQFAPGDLVAHLDSSKIKQVLINLIQNAADAIEGGGRIEVSVARCPDGRGAIFVVSDDGPGIPPKHQKSVFEPFFTTKFSGTGLGLAIARSLVEQHEGSLEFESSPSEGTTFFVILPEPEEADDANPTEPNGERG